MPRKLKILSIFLCFLLIFQQTGFTQIAGELDISTHFAKLSSSFLQPAAFRPLHLRYISHDPVANNFNLLLDKGDFLKGLSPQEMRGQSPSGTDPELSGQKLKEETRTLLNYFFIGISLPNSSFWVNLRPNSPDNIIDPELAETDVGKILLEADLQLKKDTASFTSPQTPEGREYWEKLYKKAEELYGNENITIPTLTRPWIVPDEIIIRESKDNAYIYKATLKVMLEQDYLKDSSTHSFPDQRSKALNEYSSQLIRETIIPKLTKEINSSKRYAPLRQVYYSLILAQWFKQKFYGKSGVYSYLIDRHNLDGLTSTTSWSKAAYFNAYKTSFQQGEYNIKEPRATPYGQSIRSYMSGGIEFCHTISSAITENLIHVTIQQKPPAAFLQSHNIDVQVAGSPLIDNPEQIEISFTGSPEISAPSALDSIPAGQPQNQAKPGKEQELVTSASPVNTKEFKIADQSIAPIVEGDISSPDAAARAEFVDLNKLPAGTLVHYEIAGDHWDYTLRLEEGGHVSIWLGRNKGRILCPITAIGNFALLADDKPSGILEEGKVAYMPYFHQTPFTPGDRSLEYIGREGFNASPENISVALPGGISANDLESGALKVLSSEELVERKSAQSEEYFLNLLSLLVLEKNSGNREDMVDDIKEKIQAQGGVIRVDTSALQSLIKEADKIKLSEGDPNSLRDTIRLLYERYAQPAAGSPVRQITLIKNITRIFALGSLLLLGLVDPVSAFIYKIGHTPGGRPQEVAIVEPGDALERAIVHFAELRRVTLNKLQLDNLIKEIKASNLQITNEHLIFPGQKIDFSNAISSIRVIELLSKANLIAKQELGVQGRKIKVYFIEPANEGGIGVEYAAFYTGDNIVVNIKRLSELVKKYRETSKTPDKEIPGLQKFFLYLLGDKTDREVSETVLNEIVFHEIIHQITREMVASGQTKKTLSQLISNFKFTSEYGYEVGQELAAYLGQIAYSSEPKLLLYVTYAHSTDKQKQQYYHVGNIISTYMLDDLGYIDYIVKKEVERARQSQGSNVIDEEAIKKEAKAEYGKYFTTDYIQDILEFIAQLPDQAIKDASRALYETFIGPFPAMSVDIPSVVLEKNREYYRETSAPAASSPIRSPTFEELSAAPAWKTDRDGRKIWSAGRVEGSGKQLRIESVARDAGGELILDSSQGYEVVAIEGFEKEPGVARLFVLKHEIGLPMMSRYEDMQKVYNLRDNGKRSKLARELLSLLLQDPQFSNYAIKLPEVQVIEIENKGNIETLIATEYIGKEGDESVAALKSRPLGGSDRSSEIAEKLNHALLDVFFGALLYQEDREYLVVKGAGKEELVPFDFDSAFAPLYYYKNGIDHTYNASGFLLKGEAQEYEMTARQIGRYVLNNKDKIMNKIKEIWGSPTEGQKVTLGKDDLLNVTPETIWDFLEAQANRIEDVVKVALNDKTVKSEVIAKEASEKRMWGNRLPADLRFIMSGQGELSVAGSPVKSASPAQNRLLVEKDGRFFLNTGLLQYILRQAVNKDRRNQLIIVGSAKYLAGASGLAPLELTTDIDIIVPTQIKLEEYVKKLNDNGFQGDSLGSMRIADRKLDFQVIGYFTSDDGVSVEQSYRLETELAAIMRAAHGSEPVYYKKWIKMYLSLEYYWGAPERYKNNHAAFLDCRDNEQEMQSLFEGIRTGDLQYLKKDIDGIDSDGRIKRVKKLIFGESLNNPGEIGKAPDVASLAEGETTSSPAEDDLGGIDMRSLPKYTKVEQVSGRSAGGGLKVSSAESAVPDKEWQEIERMANSGIAPSPERIREYLLSLQDPNTQADKVLACIADILRQEEEKACCTESSLKEILVLLESGKPTNELKLALTKVEVLAQGPQLTVQ